MGRDKPDVRCHTCRRQLYTDVRGRCRACGAKATLGQNLLSGRQTWTAAGAERLKERAVDEAKARRAGERAMAKLERQRLRAEEATRRAEDRDRTSPRLAGLTWQQPEAVSEDWMKRNGHPNAQRTRPGADGGVDVRSSTAVAQVKHHARPVGIAELQRLTGIAQSERKQPIFFSLSGYTKAAADWGRSAGALLLIYPPVREFP